MRFREVADGKLTSRNVHLGLVAAGLAAGVLFAAGAVANPYNESVASRLGSVPISVAVGWSFLLVGLVAGRSRPDNPVGLLMSAFGLVWFSAGLQWIRQPVTVALGDTLRFSYLAVLGHLYIVYPRGRPTRRVEAWSIAAIYAWWVLGSVSTEVTNDPSYTGCQNCGPNPFYLPGSDWLHTPMVVFAAVATALVAALVLGIVVRHWIQASPPARRALAPAAWTALPIFLVVLAFQLSNAGGIPDALQQALGPIEMVIFALLPLALLIGVLRTRLGRGAISDLVLELGRTPAPGHLRDALARALGDPSLELALVLPGGGYVDGEGRPTELPGSDDRRSVTMIPNDGEPLAALVHDPALDEEDPGLVAAAGSAARFAIENERLHAEVRARLDEVRASRARILEAADAERRKLERDIHDGAQQRLAALALGLRLARDRAAAAGDPALVSDIDEASGQLKQALSELRQLAQGIHPAVLTRAGIGPALRSLAELSPIPVDIVEVPGTRYQEAVEAAVYFCVSEALANVTKHAQASQVSIAVRQEGDQLLVRVSDDGVGGADPSRGSGLVGMGDRIAVLGGRLELASPARGGTMISALIPCA
jgi:signal transduction histidine kinase